MKYVEEKYTMESYETYSKKRNNRIIIFPNIPFWIAVSEQGFHVLEEMKETGSIEETAKRVFGEVTENKLIEIKQFFQPLIESQVLYKGEKKQIQKPILKPNKITFLQTMCCNLKCRHCCVSDMPNNELKSMSLETAKKVLDRCLTIMDEGNKGLSFLGGEPLCGDRFNELLEYAHKLGFQIGLSTNGILVDEDFAKIAAKNKINVQISLDGTDKESHEYVRGEGTWEKAINAIDILNEYNVDIQTNLVYHRGNIDKLEEYFDFAKKKHIKKVRLISLMNMGRAVGQMERVPLDEFVDVMYDLLKSREDIVEFLDETSFMGLVMGAKFSQKMISCGAGVITLTISPQGNIYPCLNLYNEKFKFCNILSDNFQQEFEQSDVRKTFLDLNICHMNEECKKCNMKYFCGGRCRGETFQETGQIEESYPYCNEWKKAMEKIFWILTEYPQLGKKKYLEIKSKTGDYLNLWH